LGKGFGPAGGGSGILGNVLGPLMMLAMMGRRK
jgi:hypothetical protein